MSTARPWPSSGRSSPAYLQEQTEENVERFTSCMNEETEQLEIGEPLERYPS